MKQIIETQELSDARNIFAQLSEEYQKILGPLSAGFNDFALKGTNPDDVFRIMKELYPEAVEALEALKKIP